MATRQSWSTSTPIGASSNAGTAFNGFCSASPGKRHGQPRWEGRCYCRTGTGLLRRVHELAGQLDATAPAILEGLPEWIGAPMKGAVPDRPLRVEAIDAAASRLSTTSSSDLPRSVIVELCNRFGLWRWKLCDPSQRDPRRRHD